ncbi:MAG: hypothetical protein RLZZ475_2539 [Pseudomonadota bacterium]|jgi:SPP1 gp7 family putative phage head morphogenesis protein
MRYDLAQMVRQSKKRPRKRTIALRPVIMPATLASDLYSVAYSPVIAAWTEALPAILAEYERSLAQVTDGATTDGAAELSAVATSIENGVTGLIVTLRLRLERWAARLEAMHRAKWVSAVKTGTGLDISAMVGAGDARAPLGTVIERNVALVKSVSEQSRAKITEAVFRGLQQRRSAADVGREIREAVAMSRRRALNIASDQTTKAAAALQTERAREAGLNAYEWIHSGKVHYRPEHLARNGKRYEYGELGDDEPGSAPFCGCVARAVLSLEDDGF